MARINIKDISIKSKPISETDNVRIILCPFNYKGGDLQKITTELEKKATVFNYTFQDTQRNLVNIVVNFESVLDMHIFIKSQSSNDNVYNYVDTCSFNKKDSIKNGCKESNRKRVTIKYDIENIGETNLSYWTEYKFQLIIREGCHKIKDFISRKICIEVIPDNDFNNIKKYPDDTGYYILDNKNMHPENYGYYIINDENKREFILDNKLNEYRFITKDLIWVDFKKEIKVTIWEIDNKLTKKKKLYEKKYSYPTQLKYLDFTNTDIKNNILKKIDEKEIIKYQISKKIKEEKVQRKEFSWELSDYEKLNIKPFSKKINKAKDKLTEIYKGIKPQETAQPKSDNIISSQLNTDINPLNSDEHNRINQFITEYYQEFLSNPDLQDKYIKELTHSQYPVMAYPVYPESAYYYLKQISERFILPASGSMPDNSIALFVNNPAFVEAFLCGMNTEMGRELLWREYPTDSRGSYFRKFWDTEVKKNIKEELRSDTFFDILPIHKWEHQEGKIGYIPLKSHKLGQNHSPGKDNLLIFAIKGELMKKYPETIIYLSKASLKGNKIKINPDAVKILPDLSAWLSEDTYLVGFPAKLHELIGNPTTRDPGYFLTFMNRPGETRFASSEDNVAKTVSNAAETAGNLLVQPYMFGKHISQFLSGWQNAPQR